MRGRSLFQRRRQSRSDIDRQIVITAEKTETYVIHQRPEGSVQAFCRDCDERTGCLTVEQVVNLTGLSARSIFRLVEAGEVHYCETEEGHLILCSNSIASYVRL